MKKNNLVPITIYLTETTLTNIAVYIDQGIYHSRPALIRHAIKKELEEQMVLHSEREKLEKYYNNKIRNKVMV